MDNAYVLDSYAMIAHLEDEDGAARVAGLLKSARARKAKLFMSVVNFGEVYYIARRERGREQADEARLMIEQLPLEIIDADKELTMEAARLKAEHSVAYADCFTAALGILKEAKVVTGDPEFRQFGDAVRIEWL